jgi:hypothetical protein
MVKYQQFGNVRVLSPTFVIQYGNIVPSVGGGNAKWLGEYDQRTRVENREEKYKCRENGKKRKHKGEIDVKTERNSRGNEVHLLVKV